MSTDPRLSTQTLNIPITGGTAEVWVYQNYDPEDPDYYQMYDKICMDVYYNGVKLAGFTESFVNGQSVYEIPISFRQSDALAAIKRLLCTEDGNPTVRLDYSLYYKRSYDGAIEQGVDTREGNTEFRAFAVKGAGTVTPARSPKYGEATFIEFSYIDESEEGTLSIQIGDSWEEIGRYTDSRNIRWYATDTRLLEGFGRGELSHAFPLRLRIGFPDQAGFFREGTGTVTVQASAEDFPVTITGAVLTPVQPEAVNVLVKAYYLRGISGVQAVIAAQTQNAEITKYTVEVGGVKTESETATVQVTALPVAGEITVVLTAMNDKGSYDTRTETITVLPYQKPRIEGHTAYNEVRLVRMDENGTESDEGTVMKLYCRLVLYEWNAEIGFDYAGELWWKWREYGKSWIGLQYLRSCHWGAFGNDEVVSLMGGIDPNKSYEVMLYLLDSVGYSHSVAVKLSTKTVSFSLCCGKTGAAFGKKAEDENVIDIAKEMTLRVRGQLVVEDGGWKQVTARADSSVWEAQQSVGMQTESGCWYRVENGSHVHAVFNRAFRFTGSEIYLNTEPLPEAVRPQGTVYRFCVCQTGTAVCRVGTDGYLVLQSAPSGISEWIDGHLDYWKGESV